MKTNRWTVALPEGAALTVRAARCGSGFQVVHLSAAGQVVDRGEVYPSIAAADSRLEELRALYAVTR